MTDAWRKRAIAAEARVRELVVELRNVVARNVRYESFMRDRLAEKGGRDHIDQRTRESVAIGELQVKMAKLEAERDRLRSAVDHAHKVLSGASPPTPAVIMGVASVLRSALTKSDDVTGGDGA